jgi:hypothetical protein
MNMRGKLRVMAAIAMAGLGVAASTAQSRGQESHFVARTGPIDAASLETSSFDLCDRDEPFDYRRARLYFADAARKQDAEIARLTAKYAALDPKRLRRASVKGGRDEGARWREKIGVNLLGLRFTLEGFMPIERHPRAIYSWPRMLKDKNPIIQAGAGQMAQLKIAFLRTMFSASPGSHASAASYVEDIATLWAMSSSDDRAQGTAPATLEDLLAQWQMIQASYPTFKAAVERTVDDPAFEQAMWSHVRTLCQNA